MFLSFMNILIKTIFTYQAHATINFIACIKIRKIIGILRKISFRLIITFKMCKAE